MALSDQQISRLDELTSKAKLTDTEMAEMESLTSQASSGSKSSDGNADIQSRMDAQIAKDYPRSMSKADKMGAGMALEGGGGAIGQAIGASPVLAGPTMGLSVPVGGFIGGAVGNLANQYTQRARGDRSSLSLGEAMGAGVGSMIPGAPMAGAGMKAVAKEGLKQGAANLAGTTVESMVDNKGQLPNIGSAMASVAGGMVGAGVGRALDTGAKPTALLRKQIDNAERDQTLAAARAANFKIAPSQLSDAPAVARALEWLAGESQTVESAQKAARAANLALARKAVGMPVDEVVNKESLALIRENQGKIYGEAANVSNAAKSALESFQTARDNARAYWLENKRNGTVASRTEAQAWDAKKKDAWKALSDELDSRGRQDLIPAINNARVTIAKTHLIEDAFEEGEGSVMADLIAKRRKSGKTITTDELEVMADFAKASGMRGGKPNKASYVAHPLLTGTAIGTSIASGAGPGMAVGAVALPFAAKSLLMSNPVQNALMNPSYRTPMPMDIGAAMGSLSAMAGGREMAREQRPVPYR